MLTCPSCSDDQIEDDLQVAKQLVTLKENNKLLTHLLLQMQENKDLMQDKIWALEDRIHQYEDIITKSNEKVSHRTEKTFADITKTSNCKNDQGHACCQAHGNRNSEKLGLVGTQKLVSSETGSVQVRPITPRKAEEQKEEEAIRVKSTKVKNSHDNKNDKINRDRTRTQNHVQTQQYIKPSDINSAIKSANEAAIMREILELGNNQPPSDESTKDGGNWETRRTKKRRRFIIGGNEENTGIEAVPKYSTLHVTRLKPDTKPEDLEKLLKERFPEVRCEQHASKRPDLYATVKVTIRKEHYREAWKKEVWPIGALVSNFFFPRRMPQKPERLCE
ncbi:unnamed protein product [Phaedon cochleariae]|uniref:Uncharacterized protein n=1 Tax=Phaedon cochleariae TaxID=80249 RepID=A0A9N9SJD1_PHACE|nr:unnamed protein product [Phaedon cochleariae]